MMRAQLLFSAKGTDDYYYLYTEVQVDKANNACMQASKLYMMMMMIKVHVNTSQLLAGYLAINIHCSIN